jgi:hypothetical protein
MVYKNKKENFHYEKKVNTHSIKMQLKVNESVFFIIETIKFIFGSNVREIKRGKKYISLLQKIV